MCPRRTAGAVKASIARFDGVVDLVCAGIVVYLPESESDNGHVVPAV